MSGDFEGLWILALAHAVLLYRVDVRRCLDCVAAAAGAGIATGGCGCGCYNWLEANLRWEIFLLLLPIFESGRDETGDTSLPPWMLLTVYLCRFVGFFYLDVIAVNYG